MAHEHNCEVCFYGGFNCDGKQCTQGRGCCVFFILIAGSLVATIGFGLSYIV
jgi:hypothetical protein